MPTKRNHGRFAAFAGICAAASLALAACTSSDPGASNGDEDITIRIAMGSSGDAVDSQWDVLAERYHEKYPNRTVEPVIQEDDIYQTTGLPTLLSSREAPDAYFEWSGPRMRGHVSDGDGYDLSTALKGDLFAGRYADGAFTNMDVDGSGIYMVPWTGDVTNVVWYDKAVFKDLGLSGAHHVGRLPQGQPGDPRLGQDPARVRQQGPVARGLRRVAPRLARDR